MVIEIDAYDPDGDPMYYEWVTYYGWFIVDGQYVYACTTAENYVAYEAPSFYPDYDRLLVTVHDDRGGWASITGNPELHDPGYSCLCGDVYEDSIIELGDLVWLIGYLRGGPPPPDPYERGDVNNDCLIDLGDVLYLRSYLYSGGPCPECCWFPPEQ